MIFARVLALVFATGTLSCAPQLRGECPIGGLRVTGYATEAARYGAITGGRYAITGHSGAADEEGTCALPGGASCGADAYYRGTCGAASGL